ncbi:MAG: hypothetical protein QM786_02705 [Breznakibacter sp.]
MHGLCGNILSNGTSVPVESCEDGGGTTYSLPYPNPVADVLYVEIDGAAYESASASYLAATGTRAQNGDPTFDLRLYNPYGYLLRSAKAKGGRVQLNVSGLPNGIYYLHVHDGSGNRLEMHQIVVEH